jgi:hypothetical protein
VRGVEDLLDTGRLGRGTGQPSGLGAVGVHDDGVLLDELAAEFVEGARLDVDGLEDGLVQTRADGRDLRLDGVGRIVVDDLNDLNPRHGSARGTTGRRNRPSR